MRKDKMGMIQRNMLKEIPVFAVIILLVGVVFIPSINADFVTLRRVNLNDLGRVTQPFVDPNEEEVDLLHGENILILRAKKDVNSFSVTYAVPPNYENQAPMLFEIKNDSSAEIISYHIENDTNPPNKVVNFTIAPMKKGENASLHFDYWVLVKNKKFEDLPEYVKIPAEDELPEYTKTWLVSTEAIQSDNVLIKFKSTLIKGFDDNLIKFAKRVVFSTSHHRPFISLLSMIFGLSHPQDALSTFFLGGVCTGLANLGTALFRANGIPAKDLIVMPTVGIWFQMHFISEYYCPDYGWVTAETSLGVTPYEPKYDIILRINYPEDEDKAGNAFTGYSGVEQWFWINNENVWPYYHGIEASKSGAWIKNAVITSEINAEAALNITQQVWEFYTKYLGADLSGEDEQHFNKAVEAQEIAKECLNQSDVDGYIENMTFAYSEYREIEE